MYSWLHIVAKCGSTLDPPLKYIILSVLFNFGLPPFSFEKMELILRSLKIVKIDTKCQYSFKNYHMVKLTFFSVQFYEFQLMYGLM